MNKYNNAKVYKIISDQENSLVYIGSTTEKNLSNRLSGHRTAYKLWKGHNKVSHIAVFDIFETYGVENCKIVLIENCEVRNRDELRQREQHYMDEYDCVNKKRAFTSEESKKIRVANYNKMYRVDNADTLSEKRKQNYQKDLKNDRERQKLYRETHREEIKLWQKQPTHCHCCNSTITKSGLSNHNKTKKHLNNVAKQEL